MSRQNAPAGAQRTWTDDFVGEMRTLRLDDPTDEVVGELLVVYLEDGLETVGRIMDAAARLDLTDLERLAHRVRGASLSLGAERVAAAATELERAAEVGDAAAAFGLAQGVAEEFERVRSKMARLIPAVRRQMTA